MPPNPRLSIFLSEDYTSPSTPAPLGPADGARQNAGVAVGRAGGRRRKRRRTATDCRVFLR